MIRPYLLAPDTAEEVTAVFQEDVIGFLHDYLERKDLRFQAFRDLWASRRFSLLHHCCPGFCDRRRYMQQLFGSVATLLAPAIKLKQGDHPLPTSLAWKVGVVYVLHCLYHTQILNPKEGIRISPPTRNRLSALFQQLSRMGPSAEDALYILSKLETEECFIFAAYEGPVSHEKALSTRLDDSQNYPDASVKISLEMDYICGNDVFQLAHDMKKYESSLAQIRKAAEGQSVVEGLSLPDILCQKLLWMGEKSSIPPKLKPLPRTALGKRRMAEEKEATAEKGVPSEVSQSDRAEIPQKKKKKKKAEEQNTGSRRTLRGDEGILHEDLEDLQALVKAERERKILETQRLRQQHEVTPGDADDLAELFTVPDQPENEDMGFGPSSEEEMDSWNNASGSGPGQGNDKGRSSRPTKPKTNRKSRKDERRIEQLNKELGPQQLGRKGRDQGSDDLNKLIEELNDHLHPNEKKKVRHPARRRSSTANQVAGRDKRLISKVDRFLGGKKQSATKSTAEEEGDPLFALLQSELERGEDGQSHGGGGGSGRGQKRTYTRKNQGRGTQGNARKKGSGALSLLDMVPAQSNSGLQVGEREFKNLDIRQGLQAPAETGQTARRSGRGVEGENGGTGEDKRRRYKGRGPGASGSGTNVSNRDDDDIFAAIEAELGSKAHNSRVRRGFAGTVGSLTEDEELLSQLSWQMAESQVHHQSPAATGEKDVNSNDDEAIFANLNRESRKEPGVVDPQEDEAILARFEKDARKKPEGISSKGNEAPPASLSKESSSETEHIDLDDDDAIFAELEKEISTKQKDTRKKPEGIGSRGNEAPSASLNNELRSGSEDIDPDDDDAIFAGLQKERSPRQKDTRRKSEGISSENDEAPLPSLNKELRSQLQDVDSDDDDAIFAGLEKELSPMEKDTSHKPEGTSSEGDEALPSTLSKELRSASEDIDSDDDDAIFADLEKEISTKQTDTRKKGVSSKGDEASSTSLSKDLSSESEDVDSDDDDAIFAEVEKEILAKPSKSKS